MLALPLTSSVAPGVLVLMPTFAVDPVPDWNRTELPIALVLVHSGTKFTVPEPVTLAGGGAKVFPPALELAVEADDDDAALGGRARLNAVGRSPPMGSASAGFNAYGTLKSNTRDSPDGPSTCTRTHC